jgi:acetyltransferase-like isoleucine patch superfamily enzyme
MNTLISKIRFDLNSDRIGPDIPFTHWRLYFKKLMKKLCLKKFGYFASSADFRPGAYAIDCSKISIGENVVIRPSTMLFGDKRSQDMSIIIEDDVLLGPGIQIYVNNHKFEFNGTSIINANHTEPEPVILRKGCWIGANSIILAGVEIGENSVIGAGSIVTRSVPREMVAVGNPAKIIKSITVS